MSTTTMPLAQSSAWNFKRLGVAFLVGVVLQMMFVPCLCDIGRAKILFAFAVDALLLVRIAVALVLRERGNGWKFYAWLLYTSPLWIEGTAYLIFGHV